MREEPETILSRMPCLQIVQAFQCGHGDSALEGQKDSDGETAEKYCAFELPVKEESAV